MEASERTLGEEHPSTLSAKANLTATYWNQGRSGNAIELMKHSALLSSSVLGHDHPDTLRRYQQTKEWIGKGNVENAGSRRIANNDASDCSDHRCDLDFQ
jgi:hypothetical protein